MLLPLQVYFIGVCDHWLYSMTYLAVLLYWNYNWNIITLLYMKENQRVYSIGIFRPVFSCLQAYAKFSGAPLQTCVTNNPFWTPKGRLPVFKHGKQVLSSFPEISAYLRRKVTYFVSFYVI